MATRAAAERQQVIDGLARELASVARELAGVGLTADLAVARHDWECVCAASEKMAELQRNWFGLYRRLLAIRVPPGQLAERSSV